MIVQAFRIHIINDIISKPRVDTTMNRNSKPVWCVHGIYFIYVATCISEYTKVMYSLFARLKLECNV